MASGYAADKCLFESALIAEKEDRLAVAHDKEGRKRYGKKRWENANFGWSQEHWAICSKVYGDPCVILTTELKGKKIAHSESDY